MLRLAAHAQGWARLQKGSPWALLAHAVGAPARPCAAPWLTKLAVDMAARDPGRGDDPDQRTLLEIQAVGRTPRADAQLAEAFGIRLHNLFTDSAVIAAAGT